MEPTTEPAWLTRAKALLQPLLDAAEAVLARRHPNLHLSTIPYLAALHLRASLQASLQANYRGHPSVALCLIRQSVEALTLIDLGLQLPDYSGALLKNWEDGKKTHGQLRAQLEKDVWPRYGAGLWEEPWTQFFGNLARAVQPYAHYSPELMRWQISFPNQDPVPGGDGTLLLLAKVGRNASDPVKASRICLLNALVVWTVGRLLLANEPVSISHSTKELVELGTTLGGSQLLFKNRDWSEELMGHVWFRSGHAWSDPPLTREADAD